MKKFLLPGLLLLVISFFEEESRGTSKEEILDETLAFQALVDDLIEDNMPTSTKQMKENAEGMNSIENIAFNTLRGESTLNALTGTQTQTLVLRLLLYDIRPFVILRDYIGKWLLKLGIEIKPSTTLKFHFTDMFLSDWALRLEEAFLGRKNTFDEANIWRMFSSRSSYQKQYFLTRINKEYDPLLDKAKSALEQARKSKEFVNTRYEGDEFDKIIVKLQSAVDVYEVGRWLQIMAWDPEHSEGLEDVFRKGLIKQPYMKYQERKQQYLDRYESWKASLSPEEMEAINSSEFIKLSPEKLAELKVFFASRMELGAEANFRRRRSL